MSLLHRSLPLLRFRPLNLREIDLRPIVHKTKIRTFKNCCAFHASPPSCTQVLMRPVVRAFRTVRIFAPARLHRLALFDLGAAAEAVRFVVWTWTAAESAVVDCCHHVTLRTSTLPSSSFRVVHRHPEHSGCFFRTLPTCDWICQQSSVRMIRVSPSFHSCHRRAYRVACSCIT